MIGFAMISVGFHNRRSDFRQSPIDFVEKTVARSSGDLNEVGSDNSRVLVVLGVSWSGRIAVPSRSQGKVSLSGKELLCLQESFDSNIWIMNL